MIHCPEKSEVHFEASMEMEQTGQSSGTGTQEKRNVTISNIEELSKLAKGDSVEEVVAAVRLAAAEKKCKQLGTRPKC